MSNRFKPKRCETMLHIDLKANDIYIVSFQNEYHIYIYISCMSNRFITQKSQRYIYIYIILHIYIYIIYRKMSVLKHKWVNETIK